MPSNIRIKGGKFNTIKGDYTLVDHSRQETNIDSYNMYDTEVTYSYNNNSKEIGEKFHPYSHSRSSDDSPVKVPMVIMLTMGWVGRLLQRQECPCIE